jgi:hypothetical protein
MLGVIIKLCLLGNILRTLGDNKKDDYGEIYHKKLHLLHSFYCQYYADT